VLALTEQIGEPLARSITETRRIAAATRRMRAGAAHEPS